MREVKFIHISDLHIGRKSNEELLYGKVNDDDVLTALRKTVSHARRDKADFIFISGDLFDEPATKENLELLDNILLPLTDTAIIYCPGAHDFLKKDDDISAYEFSSNIYIAGCDVYRNKVSEDSIVFGCRDERATAMVDIIRFDKMGICVHAAGYYARIAKINAFDEAAPYDNSYYNVLLGYGGSETGIGISYPDLKKKGFNYIGLGGEHTNKLMYNGKICYPGSLEPLSGSETGHHGYIEGVIKENGVSCRLHPASKKEYKTINYPISNYMGNEELADELKRIMINEGKNNIFRINLVRTDKCEKTFDIRESLSGFRISAIEGERFVRKDYDEYIRANRGNEFGKLLSKRYGESPVKEDAAKLAIDSVIEASGICYRHNKKLNDRIFEDTVKKELPLMKKKKKELLASDEVKEYEKARQMLESNPDVLDMLNKAWADERKAELTLKTARSNMEQILPGHKRKWVKTGLRAAIIPFVLLIVMFIFVLPYAYINMIQKISRLDVLMLFIMGIFIVALCFFMGYFFSKMVDANRRIHTGRGKKNTATGYREELAEAVQRITEYESNVDELKKIRRNYQIMDNRRREIISDMNVRESNVEKVYYEVQLIDEAIKILSASIEVT